MHKIKTKIGIAALFVAAFTASAQTNEFYQSGELDLQVGPSIYNSIVDESATQYGYSLETVYWQTAHTGTSFEIGDNAFRRGVISVINYTDAKEKFRIVPFYRTPFWDRLELESETGPERWLDDGTTGLALGAAAQWAFTKSCGLRVGFDAHFDLSAPHTGQSGILEFVWKF